MSARGGGGGTRTEEPLGGQSPVRGDIVAGDDAGVSGARFEETGLNRRSSEVEREGECRRREQGEDGQEIIEPHVDQGRGPAWREGREEKVGREVSSTHAETRPLLKPVCRPSPDLHAPGEGRLAKAQAPKPTRRPAGNASSTNLSAEAASCTLGRLAICRTWPTCEPSRGSISWRSVGRAPPQRASAPARSVLLAPYLTKARDQLRGATPAKQSKER